MSTVNINVEDITGAAMACDVIFTPLSTPSVIGGQALILSGSRGISTGSDGIGSITLEPGEYEVRFQGIPRNIDAVQIVVPDDNLSYYLTALISSGVVPAPQPLFNLMGFSVNERGALVPDPGLIPGGQFQLNERGVLVPLA